MKKKIKYKRILLKITGESLQGNNNTVDPRTSEKIAGQLIGVYKSGVELAIVIGGGNIFRGISASAKGMDRATADYMGMLATTINSLALQDALEKQKVSTRVLTAISMHNVAEPYIRRRAIRHLEKKRIVILAAGTGNPYFSTDTAAALRALELKAEIIIKATKVDGVYDKDPAKFRNAKKFPQISFLDVLNKKLKVMDATAISLCMENKLPIAVLNINKKSSLKNFLAGKKEGTLVK